MAFDLMGGKYSYDDPTRDSALHFMEAFSANRMVNVCRGSF